MHLPNDIVGEELPANFGPLETTLIVHSSQPEWTTSTFEKNVAHVEASASGSSLCGGVPGSVRFTVSEDEWQRLNREVVQR